MSHPRDLDEISEPELLRELVRRDSLRGHGRCDYCGRKRSSTPICKFQERHTLSGRCDEGEGGR